MVQHYTDFDSIGLAKAIKQNQISSMTVLEQAFAKIADLNPTLNAMTHVMEDYAYQQLKKLTGNEPFYGVPFVVKELGFTVKGMPARSGSALLSHVRSPEHNPVVEQLLTLGMVPIGLTNSPEFGLSFTTEPSLFGPCRNPFDKSRSVGGSSGGTAAAIASGIVPVGTASDGGGSIRVPAACCGLFGFKPSSGVLPTGPITPDPWSGMAVGFILSRSLRDCQTLFSTFLDLDTSPNLVTETNKPTFWICPNYFPNVPISPSWQKAFDEFTQSLESHGYTVQSCEDHLDTNAINEAALYLIKAHVATEMKRYEQFTSETINRDKLENITWEFYQQGKSSEATDFLLAKDSMYQKLAPLRSKLAKGDVIIQPTLAQDPYPIGRLLMSQSMDAYLETSVSFSPFTNLSNQAGIPAANIPIIPKDEGMPKGIQLIMGKYRDLQLLGLCEELLAKGVWEDTISPNLHPL